MNPAPKVLIIGSGPYAIGSSVEFDWCSVQALRHFRRLGCQTIFVNSNPETVSTDFDECDRLYFEELSLERILDICEHEKPDGLLCATGGQIAQNLALQLSASGIKILGTPVSSIENCEDRGQFSTLCDELGIAQPSWASFTTFEQAHIFAKKVGYPVLVRPSFVLSGAAMAIVVSRADLRAYLQKAIGRQTSSHIVISKFEQNAKEIEFDAVAQDGRIILSSIAEHIENAGVHSGDATIVLPPQNMYLETIRRVQKAGAVLAKKLKISGPFNVQFLARHNEIKIIECNLRASRTLPFVSKTLQQNFIATATEIWFGQLTQSSHQLTPAVKNLLDVDIVGVKAAQFSFSRLKNSDPNLGVEMNSTGEAACFGANFNETLLQSLLSVGFALPQPKSWALLTLGRMADKVDFLSTARQLQNFGCHLAGTEGTANFLQQEGIKCLLVHKIATGQKPDVLDFIAQKKPSLVINTPNKFSHNEISDGYAIRRAAIDYNIPLLVNLSLAKVLIRSLVEIGSEAELTRHLLAR